MSFKSYHKQPVFKSEHYLNYIRLLDCIVCGESPPDGCEAHHETFGDKALGDKSLIPDTQTLPICLKCHVPIRHGMGYDSFYAMINKDPKLLIIANVTRYLQWIRNEGAEV